MLTNFKLVLFYSKRSKKDESDESDSGRNSENGKKVDKKKDAEDDDNDDDDDDEDDDDDDLDKYRLFDDESSDAEKKLPSDKKKTSDASTTRTRQSRYEYEDVIQTMPFEKVNAILSI